MTTRANWSRNGTPAARKKAAHEGGFFMLNEPVRQKRSEAPM